MPQKPNISSFFAFVYEIKFSFLKILFIYLRESMSEGRCRGRGRSRLPLEEPDVWLDPRTLGSHPELKADA